jgi:hypothetical protein
MKQPCTCHPPAIAPPESSIFLRLAGSNAVLLSVGRNAWRCGGTEQSRRQVYGGHGVPPVKAEALMRFCTTRLFQPEPKHPERQFMANLGGSRTNPGMKMWCR